MTNSIIIIPDVHGRSFWKDAVHGREDQRIIFLGDYLDPYGFEWTGFEGDPRPLVIANFKEIIEFKKAHMDNVTLLLGNHDCTYMYSTYVCDCRRDRENYYEIQHLFRDNAQLFDIACRETVGDKEYVFSHSGIQKGWLDGWTCPTDGSVDIVDYLNNLNAVATASDEPADSNFCAMLSDVSWYRGGYSRYSSVVWGDIRDIVDAENELYPSDCMHIVGHTLSRCEYIDKIARVAMLDCRKAFVLDNEGNIKEIENGR